jgi:hypothetical protein
MGHRGPPPKPTALKLIAGNPGKKALPKDEPKPKVELPSKPRHLTTEEQLAKASALAFTHNGYPIVNPWLTISNQAVEQMRKFLGEFGLTPAARTRIGAPPLPAENPGTGGDGNAKTGTDFEF